MSREKSTRLTATVSMHRQIYEIVRDMAIAENRSTSNMIAVLVKEAVDHRDPALFKPNLVTEEDEV